MRKSTLFILATALNAGIFSLLMLHGRAGMAQTGSFIAPCRQLVRQWGLTDLCLFTEARYTRHPAMADRHAPFQDHPMALEHFPTGSFVPAPHASTGGI